MGQSGSCRQLDSIGAESGWQRVGRAHAEGASGTKGGESALSPYGAWVSSEPMRTR